MDQSSHRLRAVAALVVGLAALAVIAVLGLIVGESAVDANPEAAELAALVVPIVIVAGLVGFVIGWLWRHWSPTERELAEISRLERRVSETEGRVDELEARVPDGEPDAAEGELETPAPETDEPADPVEPSSADAAPVAASETPRQPTPAPEPEAGPPAALSMDDVPDMDIDQASAAARVSEKFADGAGAPADDLKMIKGVGPVLERLLNEMNVRTFAQVGSFGGEDIAVVSAALEAFPDRIVRDNWVGQARALHDRVHGA